MSNVGAGGENMKRQLAIFIVAFVMTVGFSGAVAAVDDNTAVGSNVGTSSANNALNLNINSGNYNDRGRDRDRDRDREDRYGRDHGPWWGHGPWWHPPWWWWMHRHHHRHYWWR